VALYILLYLVGSNLMAGN